MDPEVMSGIIGAGAAIIVAIISYIVQVKATKSSFKDQKELLEETIKHEVRQENRNLTATHITDKRTEWIYAVRNIMAEYVAYTFFLVRKYMSNQEAQVATLQIPVEECRELNKFWVQIRLYFNFSGDIDRIIIELVNKINENLGSEHFNQSHFLKHMDLLTKHTQIYLKLEWERVKLEAISIKNKEEMEIELEKKKYELYRKYVNLNDVEIQDFSLEQFNKLK